MDAKETEQLKSLIKVELDNAINGVFIKAHQFAGTKDGHIFPEQALALEDLKEEIENLIFKQTIQNI